LIPQVSYTPSITQIFYATPIGTAKTNLTPIEADGEVLKVVPVPDPPKGTTCHFDFELNKAASAVRMSVYTDALILVATKDFAGAWSQGWNELDWGLPDLSGGVYFVRLSTNSETTGKIATLYIYR
jgi:hypothetical protein